MREKSHPPETAYRERTEDSTIERDNACKTATPTRVRNSRAAETNQRSERTPAMKHTHSSRKKVSR